MSKLSGIIDKYPELVQNELVERMAPFSHWGFECSDGWYDLIDNLCSDLQHLTSLGHPQLKIMQCKEKFGLLRFNAPGGSPEQKALIAAAQNASEKICESCGAPGEIDYSASWIKVRCPKCK